MSPESAQALIWFVFAVLLGVVTSKIASDRGRPLRLGVIHHRMESFPGTFIPGIIAMCGGIDQ